MVRPERFERPTYWFVASCSIQLSYGRTPRDRKDRLDNFLKDSGTLHPNQLVPRAPRISQTSSRPEKFWAQPSRRQTCDTKKRTVRPLQPHCPSMSTSNPTEPRQPTFCEPDWPVPQHPYRARATTTALVSGWECREGSCPVLCRRRSSRP